MDNKSKLTKAQRISALRYSLMKMKFYLKEQGIVCYNLKKTVVTRTFAEIKYSETVIEIDNWILNKYLLGDFKEMKTGRKAKRKKISYDGENIKVNYNSFLKTNYWRKVRKLVLTRDGNKCAKCGSTSNLHVHHKTYKHHFYEHEHLNDLITLCELCHMIEHSNIK